MLNKCERDKLYLFLIIKLGIRCIGGNIIYFIKWKDCVNWVYVWLNYKYVV